MRTREIILCVLFKMYRARLFKLTVCLVLLQFLGNLIFHVNIISWSKYSQSLKTTNFATDALSMPEFDMVTKTTAHTDINAESSQLSQPVSAVSKSIPTVGVAYKSTSTQTNAAAVITSNQVGSWKPHTLLIQEVTALVKTQLELNKKVKPFSVTTKCVLNSTKKKSCVHPSCTQLSNNITERVQSLISEKTVLTKEQDGLLRSISLQIPEKDVILLSAASSNHYDEMQAMLHYIHSMVFPELSQTENFSLVMWDIGLTSDERQKVEKCCRCQVISFPFEKFPERVKDVHTYMWKPLIIRMTLLRARKYVVYHDASIRYRRFPGPVFENGMQLGLQLISEGDKTSTVHRTLPETFAYLGQKVCSFYPYQEVPSGFGVYKNDPFVLRAVTNLWARCGFEEKCMIPRPTMPSYHCHYGPCHRYFRKMIERRVMPSAGSGSCVLNDAKNSKSPELEAGKIPSDRRAVVRPWTLALLHFEITYLFDQSALTIITATLYGPEIYRIIQRMRDLSKYLTVQRDHKEANYFNSTGCLKS